MMEIRAWGFSRVGVTRGHNEDCYGIDEERRLYLVADGMGGHSHGEVASRTAVEAIRDFVGADDGEAPSDLLRRAVHAAHERVLGAIRRDGSLYGMGTTLVALLFDGSQAIVAHVGDSRAYRWRGDRLELLTEDHTWVQEQVMAGFLTEEQARLHPLKNVVTRALGSEGSVKVDILGLEVEAGDRFVLCSDGLTTMLDDDEIAARIESDASPEQICRRLVAAAQDRGGFDDITVVTVEVVQG